MKNPLPLLWRSVYVRLALGAATVVVVLWVWLGAIALEKLLSALAVPVGLVWIVLSLVLVEALRSRRAGLSLLAAAAWLVYTTAGNVVVAGWLAGSRESRFVEFHPMRQGAFDVVIVLGGGANQGATGRAQGNASGDRLILAAQLFHAGLARKLVCTGRRIAELDTTGLDPAGQSATILRGLGVPEEAIELAGGRNTAEEMADLAGRFAAPGLRVGLLTSAWHLRRAQRLAAKQGLDLVPLPADFITGPPGSSRTLAAAVGALIPNADAFDVSGKIVREYLADLVGR